MNISQQYAPTAKKTNQILGCISKNVASRVKEVIFLLYLVILSLHLEYCVQFGALHYKKDIENAETNPVEEHQHDQGLEPMAYKKRLRTIIFSQQFFFP